MSRTRYNKLGHKFNIVQNTGDHFYISLIFVKLSLMKLYFIIIIIVVNKKDYYEKNLVICRAVTEYPLYIYILMAVVICYSLSMLFKIYAKINDVVLDKLKKKCKYVESS